MSDADLTRVKILANLVQDARQQAGRSIADCANIVDMTPEAFADVESGTSMLSLPQLEALAMYLKVPMSYFWGSELTKIEKHQVDYNSFLQLRQRIIGALLRQARLNARRSVQDLAAHISVPVDKIRAYEVGDEEIPLFELEKLGKYLDVSLDYFSGAQNGPLAKHENEQKMMKRFKQLPPEVQEFVVEPINISYIETAMRLSDLDVNRLRSIAEGILDITF